MTTGRFPRLERAAVFGAFVSFAVLVVTGVVSALTGKPVGGYSLLAHTGMGGLFAVSLVLLGILRAETVRASAEQQVAFWLLLASGFVLIVTPALMMLPLFGTEGQHDLLHIHRYSGWVAMVTGIRYFFMIRTPRQTA